MNTYIVYTCILFHGPFYVYIILVHSHYFIYVTSHVSSTVTTNVFVWGVRIHSFVTGGVVYTLTIAG